MLLANCRFVCKKVNHEMEDWPIRRQPHSSARYIESAATRLGFYHIDLPAKSTTSNMVKNVGLGFVEYGEVATDELAAENN